MPGEFYSDKNVLQSKAQLELLSQDVPGEMFISSVFLCVLEIYLVCWAGGHICW